MKVTNGKEVVTNRVHDAFHGTGWYTEISCHRYGEVTNSNRRGGRESKNVTKEKNNNHCFTVRLGADAPRNDRPNQKFIPDHCVLILSQKNTDLTALVLTIYADRLLVVVVFIAVVVEVSLKRSDLGTM